MPKWKKGESGNPLGSPKGGRPKTSWGERIRRHPKAANVINRIYRAAMDDTDERQGTAWKILMDRLAPSLKAEEVKIKTDDNARGVIILPEKKPIKIEEKIPEAPSAEA